MLRAPKGFVDQALWPEFQELNKALTQYLNEVTTRVIRDEVHRDTSEAAEVAQALRVRSMSSGSKGSPYHASMSAWFSWLRAGRCRSPVTKRG